MRTPFAALLALLLSLSAAADTNDRLVALGHVWGMVKFAHPVLGYRDIDWDAAGVKAIARVLAGGDTRAYTDSVQEMLDALGDPVTRVVPDCLPGTPAAVLDSFRLADGTLILRPTSTALEPIAALKQSQRVIVDLRTPAGACSGPSLPEELQGLLTRTAIWLPSQQQIVHDGYKSQYGESVYSSLLQFPRHGFVAADPAAVVDRVVFLVDEQSTIPPLALALQQAGRAAIASVGPLSEDRFVSHVDVSLGEGFHTVIRTSEADSAAPGATVIPASSSESAILQTAIALLTSSERRRMVFAPRTAEDHTYEWRADATYPEMTCPPVEYRILAAFRFWNIINFFYGYLQLIDPWEPRLATMVQMMLDAQNADDYGLDVGIWMTWVPDGHSYISTPALTQLIGPAGPPFALLPIGDDYLVMNVHDASFGVQPGDALLAIDGRPIAERLETLTKFAAGSTPMGTRYRLAVYLPRGPAGSTASFTFRRPDGSTYSATLTRTTTGVQIPAPVKAWKILPGNIGYVDLSWLLEGDQAAMLNDLKDTRGLVLDMRGYPKASFATLGAMLNTTGSTSVAQFRVPRVTGGIRGEYAYVQNIPPQELRYRNKTVTLIDIRAISAAEHTCLTLEAVNGTTFIGTPTNGANGNVTTFYLPGNIAGTFTGMDVRHADGRQLQRVGIQPDIVVSPTPEGLRAGKDEVLDRAVEFLTTGH